MQCTKCNNHKTQNDFYGSSKSRICKSCQREYSRKYQQTLRANPQNKTKLKEIKKRKRVQARITARAFVDNAKSGPCSDCGKEFPPEAMDLDHRPGEKKTQCIARMVTRGCSTNSIMRELKKCDLVCACCHRIRTMLRRRG